jgi:hypothetical protein
MKKVVSVLVGLLLGCSVSVMAVDYSKLDVGDMKASSLTVYNGSGTATFKGAVTLTSGKTLTLTGVTVTGGTFGTMTLTSPSMSDPTISGTITLSSTPALSGTLTGGTLTNMVIKGSTIGSVNPLAGSFTTLGASGAATLAGGGTLTGTFVGGTLTNSVLIGCTIGSSVPAAGAFTTISATTSLTVGGLAPIYGLGGTVLLEQTTNVTMHAGTVWTNTFATVFGATPRVVIITPTELHAAVPFYSSATPSNILVTVEADKNFTLTCIGQKP